MDDANEGSSQHAERASGLEPVETGDFGGDSSEGEDARNTSGGTLGGIVRYPTNKLGFSLAVANTYVSQLPCTRYAKTPPPHRQMAMPLKTSPATMNC